MTVATLMASCNSSTNTETETTTTSDSTVCVEDSCHVDSTAVKVDSTHTK